jgi:hypothetical protein
MGCLLLSLQGWFSLAWSVLLDQEETSGREQTFMPGWGLAGGVGFYLYALSPKESSSTPRRRGEWGECFHGVQCLHPSSWGGARGGECRGAGWSNPHNRCGVVPTLQGGVSSLSIKGWGAALCVLQAYGERNTPQHEPLLCHNGGGLLTAWRKSVQVPVRLGKIA